MDYIFPVLLVMMSIWLLVDILIKASEAVDNANRRTAAIKMARAFDAFTENEKAKRKPRKLK